MPVWVFAGLSNVGLTLTKLVNCVPKGSNVDYIVAHAYMRMYLSLKSIKILLMNIEIFNSIFKAGYDPLTLILSPGRVASWLERCPHMPRLWVQSPIRTHTRSN